MPMENKAVPVSFGCDLLAPWLRPILSHASPLFECGEAIHPASKSTLVHVYSHRKKTRFNKKLLFNVCLFTSQKHPIS
jgi:hypothetical protein